MPSLAARARATLDGPDPLSLLDRADLAWAAPQIARSSVTAAWSSTGLVTLAFAPWRSRPGELRVGGLGGFEDVRIEERLHIPHGGGTPNLDVALDLPGGTLVGVEAKLTEHLAPKRVRAWKPAYRRPAMLAALDGGWAATFADLLDDRWTTRHLDAGQLVRHALSLRGAGELIYLYWEPTGADDHPEIRLHREEVAELLGRVGRSAPRLRALTWDELFDEWEPAAPAHVATLRGRYSRRIEA